jgi:hypothetical protein
LTCPAATLAESDDPRSSDAQLALASVRLGKRYPSHQLRPARPMQSLFANRRPFRTPPIGGLVHIQTVDARCALVGPHPGSIPTDDKVIQSPVGGVLTIRKGKGVAPYGLGQGQDLFSLLAATPPTPRRVRPIAARRARGSHWRWSRTCSSE